MWCVGGKRIIVYSIKLLYEKFTRFMLHKQIIRELSSGRFYLLLTAKQYTPLQVFCLIVASLP